MAIFDSLALRFVLSDGLDEDSAREAAAIIGDGATRLAVGQWVGSVNRWMPTADEGAPDDDDDVIARAKALNFLAHTLEFLRSDILKPDQINLLVGFFNSLFSSDHRAGIAACAKALRRLVDMKAFQPSLGSDIIMNATKLGEDFKRQTASTRLEIYRLVLQLLRKPLVAEDLAYHHGSTCVFMTALIDLCRSERDPQNLIEWFSILRLFLTNFSPMGEVAAEVFKAFSDYFPITLRASVTPSGITVDDLKGAVRSCFDAHHRIARLAIPFLLSKLDQGEAVTVNVKVDILQTLEACLAHYEHVKHGVVPYASHIWASLKYEVRNGEIRDIIDATLRTINTLATRLDEADLEEFFATAWKDLADDLSNPAYTSQAGQLVTSIASASPQSFSLSTKTAMAHVVATLGHTKSESHQMDLFALLNSLLLVRSALSSPEGSTQLLQDELFGDKLFEDAYALIRDGSPSAAVQAKMMDGMASLASQHAGSSAARPLCSDSVRKEILGWLAEPSVIGPLQQKILSGRSFSQGQADLRDAAVAALRRVIPLYPTGFQQILLQFLASIPHVVEDASLSAASKAALLHETAVRLASIGCSAVSMVGSPISNFVVLMNTFLNALHGLLKEPPVYWTAMIDSIHIAILCSLDALATMRQPGTEISQQPRLSEGSGFQNCQWVLGFGTEVAGLPEINLDKQGSLEETVNSLGTLEKDPSSVYAQFQGYSVFVLAQIYRCFTAIKPSTDGFIGREGAESQCAVGLSVHFDQQSGNTAEEQNKFLYQTARMATTVVRSLSLEDQKQLLLTLDVCLTFNGGRSALDGAKLPTLVFGAPPDSHHCIAVSSIDGYRTAPLAMGILQGVRPGAIAELQPLTTLLALGRLLTQITSPCSGSTRIALDTMLTILCNKAPASLVKSDEWSNMLQILLDGYGAMDKMTSADGPDGTESLAIFKSMLYFLAGDVARYRPDEASNWLLRTVCETAPCAKMKGRQLAQCFEILVNPKDCLTKENHAVLKPFRGQWLYHRAVGCYLQQCFPSAPSETDQDGQDAWCATNRSVVAFVILKHLKVADYAFEADQIIRVVIRSLTEFGVSRDIESALSVLLQILDAEPECLKAHLGALVMNTLSVYDMTRKVHGSHRPIQQHGGPTMTRREAASCRLLGVDFLRRLPANFEPQFLLPYRMRTIRGLSVACGDPVREVRSLAIAGRRAWDNLA